MPTLHKPKHTESPLRLAQPCSHTQSPEGRVSPDPHYLKQAPGPVASSPFASLIRPQLRGGLRPPCSDTAASPQECPALKEEVYAALRPEPQACVESYHFKEPPTRRPLPTGHVSRKAKLTFRKYPSDLANAEHRG